VMATFDQLPDPHKKFIDNSVSELKHDSRIFGVAAGGSLLLDTMDQFNDIDLVLYIDPKHYQEVMAERQAIAAGIGPLIECFTGEHVGEPRLLICLYGPPLLHIDFKFVSLDDIQEKVENPLILWERADQISSLLNKTAAKFPQPDPIWIEARFWTWIHYTASKIGRGELFEAIDSMSYMRATVLGPLLLAKNGARPQGLRKIEFQATTTELKELKDTLPTYSSKSTLVALRKTIELYLRLRNGPGNQRAKTYAIQYLIHIEKMLD